MSKENKYKRQHEERANEHMRKAFERFTDALAIMSQIRGEEEWTPEELEKIAKIVNEWASTLLRISEKMAKRHRSRKGAEE